MAALAVARRITRLEVMKPSLAESPRCATRIVPRRRNRALARWRRSRAIELATLGMSYEAIAREVGYSNRGTAYRAVHDALQRQISEAAEALLRQELGKLDALQAAVWGAALGGDLESIAVVHKIILSRCRLLGIDRPSEKRPGKAHRTVVLDPRELAEWKVATHEPEPGRYL